MTPMFWGGLGLRTVASNLLQRMELESARAALQTSNPNKRSKPTSSYQFKVLTGPARMQVARAKPVYNAACALNDIGNEKHARASERTTLGLEVTAIKASKHPN